MDNALKKWSTPYLMNALQELYEDEPKGIVREDGIVRHLSNMLVQNSSGTLPFPTALTVAQLLIYKEAAHRWFKPVSPTINQ